MQSLHRIMRTVNPNDLLTMQLGDQDVDGEEEYQEREYNFINFFVRSPEKMTQRKNFRLPLIRVEGDLLDIEDANFNATVWMSSAEFQKVIRDLCLNVEAKNVRITLTSERIQFYAHGETGEAEFIFNEDRNASSGARIVIHMDENAEPEISGKFDLKNLQLFTKCTQLCPEIQIFMKNSYPILIRYEIPSLGEIHLCQSAIDDSSF